MSMTDPVERIEAKVNAIARALGGPGLKEEFSLIERGLPPHKTTFRKARCGCWKGSHHRESCAKYNGHDMRRNIA